MEKVLRRVTHAQGVCLGRSADHLARRRTARVKLSPSKKVWVMFDIPSDNET